MARKNYGSKWTAEFLVASELTRHGYSVAFTQDNYTPDYDQLVGTPSGQAFMIDVKGQATKSAWLVKDKKARTGLFYILAFVPPGGAGREPDRLFILTQEEVRALNLNYRAEHPNQKDHGISGFNWRDALPHEGKWEKLPAPGNAD